MSLERKNQLIKTDTAVVPEHNRDARNLALIDAINKSAGNLGARVVLIGGYGVDAHAGFIRRPHDDIDVKLCLPPGVSSKQIFNQLFETGWIEYNVPHGETILENEKTGQRIDIHIFHLTRPATGETIQIRKPYTNSVHEQGLVERGIVDISGKTHNVWVETVSDIVADRIDILSRNPGIGRRGFRDSDYSDLLFLISHPDFDFTQCRNRLAQIIEHKERLDQLSAMLRAERLIQERIAFPE